MTEHLLYSAAVGFEAARQVKMLPMGHRARRLHGHSFLAKVRVRLFEGLATFPGGEVGALRDMLGECVAPFDYHLLNDHFAQPTDENIARWIRTHLKITEIDGVGVQSTQQQGVDVDRNNHAHVWCRYLFEAAHQLPKVPPGHKCGNMHGHGFEVIIHADQDLGQRELSIDYDHIDELWAPLRAQLHLACLNEIPGLENPTSELIGSWIWGRLKPQLPELSWVTVYETATCGAHFDGANYRIWKELSLDSSVRVKRAPLSDVRHRVHGHTYTLRLHLSAPLDEVMGWIIDFGDVKEIFSPTFLKLDHRPLHELPGIEDTDTASLASWIRMQVESELPQLDRIELYESRGCGTVLSWGKNGPVLPI